MSVGEQIKPFFRWPYVALLGLGVVFSIAYVVVFTQFQSNQLLQTWLSRFTVVSVGSYLTAIVVDRTFREKERREQERIQNTALKQLRIPVNRQLQLLSSWYIASSEEMPDSRPDTIEDILNSEDYVYNLQHLDFSKEREMSEENETWLSYSASELEYFSEEIEKVMSQYGFAMDSEMFGLLQDLANAKMLNMITSADEKGMIDALEESDVDHPEGPRTLNIFVRDEFQVFLEEYLELTSDLLEYYDGQGQPNTMNVEDLNAYRFGKPRPEGARIDTTLEESNPIVAGTTDNIE